MPKLSLVYDGVSGDWMGLYVGGKLVDEGHSLSLRNVLEELGFEVESFEVDLEGMGRCNMPDLLTEAWDMRLKL
jgi:hypothetical protein